MSEITKEQEQKFLEELSALSQKHGIIISGCGCCGSPYLSNEKFSHKTGKMEGISIGSYTQDEKNDGMICWTNSD